MVRPRGPVRWLHHLGFRRPRPEDSVAWEIEHHLAEVVDRLVVRDGTTNRRVRRPSGSSETGADTDHR